MATDKSKPTQQPPQPQPSKPRDIPLSTPDKGTHVEKGYPGDKIPSGLKPSKPTKNGG